MHHHTRNKCRHFTGIMNATCKAGINYKRLTGDRPAVYLPCMASQSTEGEVCCDKLSRYSPEEMEEMKAKRKESTRLNIQLLVAIQQMDGDRGTAVCPKCNNTVNWSKAPSNGHIHAYCTSGNCLAIMQ